MFVKAEEGRGQGKDTSSELKGAVKCSLANLLDINTSGKKFYFSFVNKKMLIVMYWWCDVMSTMPLFRIRNQSIWQHQGLFRR